MKILGKLHINPERLMKNEELITLRGGYDYDYDCLRTQDHFAYYPILATGESCEQVIDDLEVQWPGWDIGCKGWDCTIWAK